MNFLPVWQQHEQSLFLFLRKQLNDPNLAKDVLQVTYLKASQAWEKLKNPQKSKAWLWQIARHSLIDFYRKRLKEKKVDREWLTQHNLRTIEEGNERLIDLANYIPKALTLLPEKYREALQLTEIEGLSQKELAQRLGLSYSGAKSRIQRGRQKLKEIILECCLIEADAYGNILECQPRTKAAQS